MTAANRRRRIVDEAREADVAVERESVRDAPQLSDVRLAPPRAVEAAADDVSAHQQIPREHRECAQKNLVPLPLRHRREQTDSHDRAIRRCKRCESVEIGRRADRIERLEIDPIVNRHGL